MKSDIIVHAQADLHSPFPTSDYSLALLRATLEATTDGILVAPQSGPILCTNHRFQTMWGIPAELIACSNRAQLLLFVQDQLVDAASFVQGIQEGYRSSTPYCDTLHCKDGRVFERHATPLDLGEVQARVWTFRDITPQAEARLALERERTLLRTLIQSLPALVWLKDLNGHYLTCNAQVEVLLGRSEAELLGKTEQEVFPVELADRLLAEDRHTRAQQRTTVREEWLPDTHGRLHHFEITRAPLLNSCGVPIGILGIGHEITARTLTEQALRESEAALRRAQAVAHIGSWTMLFPQLELKWSEETYRMFGIPVGQPLNEQNFFERIHPEDRDLVEVAWRGALRGQPYSVPHRILVGHEIRWVHEQAEVLFDEQGKPTLATGTVQDITQQVTGHQALLESEQRYRAIFDEAAIGIARVGLDGAFLEVNAKLLDIIGYSRHELLRLTVQDVIHPDDLPTDQALRTQTLQGLQSRFSLEKRYIRKDRSLIWVNSAVTLVRHQDGSPAFFIAVIEDTHARKLAEQALRQSENRLRILIEHFPGGVLVEDSRRHITLVNQMFCSQFGIQAPAEALIGMDCSNSAEESQHLVVNPGHFLQRIENILAERKSVLGEALQLRNGQVLERDYIPVLEGKILMGHCWLYRDITARRQAEERLRLAASVFTHADEGIMITNAEAQIMEINAAFTRITGYTRAEILGKKPSVLSSGHHPPDFYSKIWAQLDTVGHWTGELWNRHKNGAIFVELLTISAVKDEQDRPSHYVGLFTDITPQKEHQRQLERLAHFDALTSLPNRVLLHDRLSHAIPLAARRGTHLAVAYVDLDGFKAINDAHGHSTGDQLLTTVATRMRQVLREGDTIARLGGDEFVAVLVDLKDTESSVPLIHRLLSAAAQPVVCGELSLQVSASIGVTFFPQLDEVDADQLLRQADHAMYQAKVAGKNRFHLFDPELDRSVRGHHESLQHIQDAMQNRQFLLHYQPKVNMRTGELIGVEALLRWQHPQRGLLLPGAFLPVIQDHPLSIQLGEWVMDEALGQLEQWLAEGLHIPISVNLCGSQVQRPDFVSRLKHLLAAHPQAPTDALELEVLETSALEELEHVSEVITHCEALGISFSLDDFGTGYSSLTYLKRLPAHYLKIDQSFVRDMLDDPDDLAILEGILGLANAFHRRAIAEGVETEEHGQMLLMLGCELAQGFGIARPMPPAMLAQWAREWRPYNSWAEQPELDPAHRALLHAGVEHRAWIRMMEDHVKGERVDPPPLDPTQCRVGKWLNGAGRETLGDLLSFQALYDLHLSVHQVGSELCTLVQQNRRHQATTRLRALFEARDAWIQQLALNMKQLTLRKTQAVTRTKKRPWPETSRRKTL